MDDIKENVIEWITGDNMISCTFTQKKYINRVKTLIESGEVGGDFLENADGSIFCHLPLSSLHLSKKRSVNISDERRAQLSEHMKKVRAVAE